ncbi:MAG: hypothetical protein EYR95_13115, partial [Phormidium sp. SL48-SHIP]
MRNVLSTPHDFGGRREQGTGNREQGTGNTGTGNRVGCVPAAFNFWPQPRGLKLPGRTALRQEAASNFW